MGIKLYSTITREKKNYSNNKAVRCVSNPLKPKTNFLSNILVFIFVGQKINKEKNVDFGFKIKLYIYIYFNYSILNLTIYDLVFYIFNESFLLYLDYGLK